jgi:entericidin A
MLAFQRGASILEKFLQLRSFFGNLSNNSVVSRSSSGYRPPAALLSNIGPARIPSPPLEACRAILHQDLVRGEKMTGFRAILLALLAGFLVAGCNTVKGVGRDIESVGEAGDRAI